MKWGKARKKPVIVEVREVQGECELIKTLEGDWIVHPEKSYVIRGVKGELYPIDKEIFQETYDIIEDFATEAEKQ